MRGILGPLLKEVINPFSGIEHLKQGEGPSVYLCIRHAEIYGTIGHLISMDLLFSPRHNSDENTRMRRWDEKLELK